MSDQKPASTRSISLPAGGTAEEILSAVARTLPRTPDAILRFADAAAAGAERSVDKAEELEATLVFSLSGQLYGAPIARVREIVRVGEIARIPGAPMHVRGVMNLRGRLLPIIELRTRITLTPIELSQASRVIVVEVVGRTIGLLVDSVADIEMLRRSQMELPPVEAATEVTDYVRALYRSPERVLLLIDVERALHIPKSQLDNDETWRRPE